MANFPMVLVTGPANSGKSEWAETLATQTRKPVIYIATAQWDETDLEWQTKIKVHQHRRPPNWQLWEICDDLGAGILSAAPETVVIVDSLGTWLANFLDREAEAWEQQVAELLVALKTSTAQIILVAEETAWGVIPAYPMGRLFRQRLGSLVRKIGGIADEVYLVTGGYVLPLHQLGMPLDSTQLLI